MDPMGLVLHGSPIFQHRHNWIIAMRHGRETIHVKTLELCHNVHLLQVAHSANDVIITCGSSRKTMGKFKGTMAQSQYPMEKTHWLICSHSLCIRGSIALCLSLTIFVGVPSKTSGKVFVHYHPKVIRIHGSKTHQEHPKTAKFPISKPWTYYPKSLEVTDNLSKKVTPSKVLGSVELMVSNKWFPPTVKVSWNLNMSLLLFKPPKN